MSPRGNETDQPLFFYLGIGLGDKLGILRGDSALFPGKRPPIPGFAL